MPKLIMLSGPSGSGKSFKARQMLVADRNAVRINRDAIREMSIDKWTPHREKWIIAAELALADAASKLKVNIIVDDTNLTARHDALWRDKAKEIGYLYEKVVFNVDIDTCIAQDNQRSGKARVGRIVIEKQFLKANLVKWPEDKQVVIFDIDGTLGDLEHRVPYITVGADCPNCKGPNKKWHTEEDGTPCPYCVDGKIAKKNHDKFYSDVMDDTPIDIVVRWIQECKKHFYVVIVSGRSPEKCDDSTLDWLKEHKIPFDRIYMRRYNMHGPDYDEKQLILDDILKCIPKEKIAFVVDDRPSVVMMWKKNGLRVIPVRGRDDDPFYSYDSEYENKLVEEVKNAYPKDSSGNPGYGNPEPGVSSTSSNS